MDLMPVLADIATARAALACLVILGRAILLLTALHSRTATAPDPRVQTRRAATAVERIVTRVVTVAQTVGAPLTILDWLCEAGIVRIG